MALANLVLPIISLFKAAGINQARNALGGLNKEMGSLGGTIGRAAGAFAGFQALTSAQQFTIQAVDATQRFERNLLALNQVFEDMSPRIENFSKQVEDYGLSQQQAAQASVFLGSVLKQYGFSVSESAGQTERLVTLAQDLATTYGYDVQDALLAITALFRGEYDPIEKFGVAMKQNEINAYLAAQGLGDLEGAELANAQATARLTLLFDRAGDSVGAFSRASDTLYASQQRLNAVMGNLQVAAGAPLQEPLAKINNSLAELAQDMGPQVVEIFEALAQAVDVVAPLIEKAGRFVLNLIAPLQQLINILTGTFALALANIGMALDVVNAALSMLNKFLDATSSIFALVELRLKQFFAVLKDSPLAPIIEAFEWLVNNGMGVVKIFEKIGDEFTKAGDAARAAAGDFNQSEFGARQASTAARRVGQSAREAQEELDNMAAANRAWTDSWTAKAQAWAEANGTTLQALKESAIAGRTDAENTGTDYVGDFFKGMASGVRKEIARVKLETMGASEGLVEAILGASGWEQVYKRILKTGKEGLQALQDQFNKTAAGIDEVAKAQQALLDAAQKAIDDNTAELQEKANQAKAVFDQIKTAAENFRKWSLENLTKIEILPNIEKQLGKFESQIASTISNIQNQLVGLLRSELISDEAFTSLQNWVNTESEALSEIARKRDELASRYNLSESLIREYQGALTGALKLTSLFNQLKGETETRIVTEVTQGVVKLGNSLREFGVTVTRSYEETVQKVTDKSGGLVQGFRDIAQKARAFAENLRKLRDMGLDPMLFNQLVQAGAEAGGETAQGIIDGGQDSVDELNTIFMDLNELGAELGMDVGQTMYEAGQDMTFGLLDGLKSEQEALLDLARELADSFSSEFASRIDFAIQEAFDKAKKAFDEAQEAADRAGNANRDALKDIQQLIDDANRALEGDLPGSFRGGVEEKKKLFEDVKDAILGGELDNIGNLVGGLPSKDVKDIVNDLLGGSSAMSANTYNITVTADTRTGGKRAGEATVEVLKAYTNRNGNLSSWVNV